VSERGLLKGAGVSLRSEEGKDGRRGQYAATWAKEEVALTEGVILTIGGGNGRPR
jgi:hypothetical protein